MTNNNTQSACHLADCIAENEVDKGPYICAFCGEPCSVLYIPRLYENHSIELTARRFAAGEIPYKDLQDDIRSLFNREVGDLLQNIRNGLENHGEPIWIYDLPKQRFIKNEG